MEEIAPSNEAPRKVFDVVPTNIGEIRMTEAALAEPAGAIRDLWVGEWAFGAQLSVLFDQESKLLLVDTFDRALKTGSEEIVCTNPALVRVVAEVGGQAVMGFVADLSYIRHKLLRYTPLGLDNIDIDSHRLEARNRSRGTELLVGVVLREMGQRRYYGPEEFADQVEDFVNDLDRFAVRAIASSTAIRIGDHRPKEIEAPASSDGKAEAIKLETDTTDED